MTLALVQALVAIILTIVATWTGLLVSVAFLMPRPAQKAEEMLQDSPWRCFLQGLGMAVVLVVGALLSNLGFPLVKLFGFSLVLLVGALMTVGAAGIAQTIGRRGEEDGIAPNFGMLVRGSLVYSLALGFPLVGWFLFAPISLVCAAGAGLSALLPERRASMVPPGVPPTPGDYDLSGGQGAI